MTAARAGVIVVGAGPTGLALASELALAGVRCVWAKHDHSFDGHPVTAVIAVRKQATS